MNFASKKNDTLVEKDTLSSWTNFKQKDSVFELITYIKKLEFTSNEEIKWFSTLRYFGNSPEITTWSSDPNFGYNIYDEKDDYTSGFHNEVSMKTVFKRDSLYTYPFRKSGTWNSDAPDAKFWEEFYENPKLILPKGTYTFEAYTDFSFSEDTENFNIKNKFKVVVK